MRAIYLDSQEGNYGVTHHKNIEKLYYLSQSSHASEALVGLVSQPHAAVPEQRLTEGGSRWVIRAVAMCRPVMLHTLHAHASMCCSRALPTSALRCCTCFQPAILRTTQKTTRKFIILSENYNQNETWYPYNVLRDPGYPKTWCKPL